MDTIDMRGEMTEERGEEGLALCTKGTKRRSGALTLPPVLPLLKPITLRLKHDMSTSCGMEQKET
jgi:hypothetical protein